MNGEDNILARTGAAGAARKGATLENAGEIGAKTAPVSAEDAVREFVQEWTPRIRSLGWNPAYTWRGRRKRHVLFNEIVSERRLRRTARAFERAYLREIEVAREAYVTQRGGPRAKALVEFFRELCRRDLFYLAKYVLGYDRLNWHLHKPMAESVQGMEPGYRGLREFPRDAYKTTVMVISLMVQEVMRNPEVRILLKSNAEPNAAKKLQEARNHFLRNDVVRRLFPEYVPQRVADQGTGTSWKCPASKAVQEDGTFVAAGVGSSKVSQHFDLIIGDDFWDEKSVTSAEVSEKTSKELESLEYLLVSPAEGRILLVGTRFAHDDPTESYLEDPSYECVVQSGLLPCGRSLFPESLPLASYARQARRNLYVFSCQVMLNPTSKDQGFRGEWLRYRRWADVQAAVAAGRVAVRKVMLLDAAADKKSTSDPVAIVVVAITSAGEYCVVDAVSEQMEPSVFVRSVCRLWDKWRPEFCVRQKTVLETTLMSFFREANRERQARGEGDVRFYDYSLGKREKKGRITAALQPLFQEGRLFVDPELRAVAAFEKEYHAHPNSKQDDFLDALSELDDEAVRRVPAAPEQRRPVPEAPRYTREDWGGIEEKWRHDSAARAFAMARGTGGAAARKAAARTARRQVGQVAA